MRPNLEKIFLIALFTHLLVGIAAFGSLAWVAAKDNPWSLVPRVAVNPSAQKVESKEAVILGYVTNVVWAGGIFIRPVTHFGFGFVFLGAVITSIFWAFLITLLYRALKKGYAT